MEFLRKLGFKTDRVTVDHTLRSLNEAWQEFGGPDGTQVTLEDAEYIWKRNHLANQRLSSKLLSTDIVVPEKEVLIHYFEAERDLFQKIKTTPSHLAELNRRITACATAIELLRKQS